MTQQTSETQVQSPEHFDVLIVGAGISGICAAWYLQQQCPDLNYAIFDAEEGYGGTWWTHRYPGIRSDSDLFTFGYSFKPWVGPPIATGEEILSYLGEVIDEHDIARNIRYQHKIIKADWSEESSLWQIEVERLDTGQRSEFSCKFLFMCQGYYRQNEGYLPTWQGMEDFQGRIVHTETWPDDVDYSGKNVVVIGSGASAATVIPALAETAANVTMLQRSPTFFRTGRNGIDIVDQLRELEIDDAWIHEVTRRKIMSEQSLFTEMCVQRPDDAREFLIAPLREVLGPDYDIDKHFNPSYRPWRQRIAFVPDADLFHSIADGKTTVVTDEIDCFTKHGIRLVSGKELEADLIVAATGFNMNIMGDIDFTINQEPVDFHQTLTYRGAMFTGVPNLAWVFGYYRASWTLRSELVSELVCRLLNHMSETGATSVEPRLRTSEQDMPRQPWVSDENFNPNYLRRALDQLPGSGTTREWQHTQDHWRERNEFPAIDIEDEVFHYRNKRASVAD